MIESFKENSYRDSAVVYKSTFEQIKKLYAVNPEQAGELAIAAIELALSGEISSDDFMIDLMLENMKVVNKKNTEKWEKKVENKKQQKIEDQKLNVIAEMHLNGNTQKQIAAALGTTQQTICNRLATIRAEYPELLTTKKIQEIQVKQTKQDYVNVNENVNDNVNVNYGSFCAVPTQTEKNLLVRSAQSRGTASREEFERRAII